MQENEDVLDWDFYLQNPPLKPARVVELIFEKKERSYFGHQLESYKERAQTTEQDMKNNEFWEYYD